DGLEVGIGPAPLRAQHGVAPHQVRERPHGVAVGFGLRRQISMADHAGAAGAVVDDDAIAAPLLDIFGEQARRHVHAAAGRIDDSELDRLGRKIFWLEPREFGLGITLRPHRASPQRGEQRENKCGPVHGLPPPFIGLRRNIRATRSALAASSTAATGRCTRIIAPSGDMTRDWRSDCSISGASTKAMTNGARSYSSLRSTCPATPKASITHRSNTFLLAE